ncbi:uncharacterized protein [Henckelia pumila]|uniref:uncharacterized protein n=1 Tax=Henckelia pumila TaxID=405737 RepID=UPI003C6DC017
MRGVVTQTPQSLYKPSKILRRYRSDVLLPENCLFSSNMRVNPSRFRRIRIRCNGIGDSGGNEYKAMLDAFFLGKALGEVINERLQSTVGEIFSKIGGLQADFLKQVQEFQEDVFEKARRAREEAMVDAKDGIELVSKSIEGGMSAVGYVTSTATTAIENVVATGVSARGDVTSTASSAIDSITAATSSAIGHVAATASSTVDDVTTTTSSAIDAAQSVVKRSADRFPKIIPKPGNEDPKSQEN